MKKTKQVKLAQLALVEYFKDKKLSKDETMRNMKAIDDYYKSNKGFGRLW